MLKRFPSLTGSKRSAKLPLILVALIVAASISIGYLFIRVQQLDASYKLVAAQVQQLVGRGSAAANTNIATIDAKLFPKVTSADHIEGPASAPITLVEYTDFECPFCQTFEGIREQIIAAYPGQVKTVFRNFPLTIHKGAERKAEIAECVNLVAGNEQYFAYAKALFNEGWLSEIAAAEALATKYGITSDQLASCTAEGKALARVKDEAAKGAEIGVSGTPTTVLILPNGTHVKIAGAQPIAIWKQQIDAGLAKK